MISKPKFSTTLLRRIAPIAIIALASTQLYAGADAALQLKGDNAVPKITTQASGTGEITVSADRNVSGAIKVTGVVATAAHIHEGEAGKNGPVVIPLNKESDGRFSVPPSARLTESQFESYEAGKLYVNVHSAAHPGGEIRAQLGQANKNAVQKVEAAPSDNASKTKQTSY